MKLTLVDHKSKIILRLNESSSSDAVPSNLFMNVNIQHFQLSFTIAHRFLTVNSLSQAILLAHQAFELHL